MPQNTNANKRPPRPQYIDEFTHSKPAASFPSVGMTLPTYKAPPKTAGKVAGLADNHRPLSFTPAEPVKASRWRRLRAAVTVKRVVLSVLLLIVLGGGWLGWKIVYNTHKLFGGSVFSILTTTKLKGENNGRVNILLAGNSADDPGHQGGNLTDSILLLSIDTQNNTGFMLSIPRDLYVAIPGNGHQKINAVYPDGNVDHFSESGYANGGMGLLEKVVGQDFGITVDYYALINYDAIRDAVNDVGGITINIQSSNPRGLYDPDRDFVTHTVLANLSNGEHTLTGEQALDLARARGDAPGSYGFAASDFTRTANQRAMLLALRAKATSAGVLANPIKLGGLFDAVGSNITTDFTLSEVHRLYDVTKNIPSNNIQSIGLNSVNGQDLLSNYTTTDHESALIPAAGIDNYTDIQQYIQQITSNNPVVREGANVVVLNGTSVSGAAAQQQTALEAKHLTVSAVADASTNTQATTQIIDNSNGKFPATKALLEQIYGSTNVTTIDPYASRYTANFIIVVGSDKVSQTSSQ